MEEHVNGAFDSRANFLQTARSERIFERFISRVFAPISLGGL